MSRNEKTTCANWLVAIAVVAAVQSCAGPHAPNEASRPEQDVDVLHDLHIVELSADISPSVGSDMTELGDSSDAGNEDLDVSPLDALGDTTEDVELGDSIVGKDGEKDEETGGDQSQEVEAPESTSQVVAPVECPALPPLCRSIFADTWEAPGGDPEGFKIPGHPELPDSAWSRWHPLKIAQVKPHTVRVWASWYNQRNVKLDAASNLALMGTTADGYLVGSCGRLKASLLPSGCVIADVSTETGVVTAYSFKAKPASSWPAHHVELNKSPDPAKGYAGEPDDLPVVGCEGVVSANQPLPLVVTATDGVTIRALEGRAQMELLVSDTTADPSMLVPSSAANASSVLELAAPGALVQPVAVDVSVCRATSAELQVSGCVCPDATWPATAPTPTGDYVGLQIDGTSTMLTPGFMLSVEGPGWTGAGYSKEHDLGGYLIESPTACCYQDGSDSWKASCSNSSPDWECAGTDFINTFYPPVIADVGVFRTKWLQLELRVHTSSPASKWKGADLMFPAVSGSLSFENALGGKLLPARQRDGALDYVIASNIAGCTVINVSATSVDFVAQTMGYVCRAHETSCAWLPVQVSGHLTRPGTP